MTPAEELALWADRLRDMAILGLRFARSEADLERYRTLAGTAVELWAVATGRSAADLDQHREAFFALPTPHPRAQVVVLDEDGVWLLAGEQDAWRLPAALYRLPDDTPAGGVRRMVAEQLGLIVEPLALTGIYDSRPQHGQQAYHAYDYVFAAHRSGGSPAAAAHRFPVGKLPEMPPQQRQRLAHALDVVRGQAAAHFDFPAEIPS